MTEIVKLSNGARVAFEALPFVRSVSVGLFVMNGSRNELGAESGMSHFIEHMLFKGTETRTAAAIAEEMDCIGGQLNAFTGKDYTCYYAKALDYHADAALGVLADMFFNSAFDGGEIRKERGVILEEINMVEDTPEDLAHDVLQAGIWKGGPLAKPILGTAASIGRFDREAMTGYFHAHYRPERTVISVAGNWTKERTLDTIARLFGEGWHTPPPIKEPRKSAFHPSVSLKEKDTEQLHVCIGFEGVTADDDETYTIAALNTILGGGMSSRLFQTVREQRGLVYSIYSYAASYLEAGLLAVYAAMNPAYAAEAVPLALEETFALAEEGVSEELLAKTKEQLKASYLLSLESSSGRMSAIGRSALLLNRVLTPEQIIGKIDGVTTDRLNSLARRVLTPKKAGLAAVGRVDGVDLEGMLRGR